MRSLIWIPGINRLLDTTDMVSRGLEVIVNVNNHYEGSAPLTIGKLARLLGTELTGLSTAG